ncbi:MAG: endoglucanase [Lachnospiraceae bacterium]|nr:endoglucanase [Lachnospiraceae bacterium]
MKQLTYEYRNCPVPGGGFVTGFLFHEREELCYARTDIGGMYRRDFEREAWIPLNDSATSEHPEETYPLSMALDVNCPARLFVVCGRQFGNGYLLYSEDYGNTFIKKELPCNVHGNRPGRSTGERLVYDAGRLYFASQSAGLFVSEDLGESWESIPVGKEWNLTFLWKKQELLVVGSSGSAASERERGDTLYVSYDGGKSFAPLPIPEPVTAETAMIVGFVPQRCCFDGSYLYVTFNATEGQHYQGMECYSCDTGACLDGRVWRYPLAEGVLGAPEDVTPFGARIDMNGFSEEQKGLLRLLQAPERRRGQDAGARLLSGGFSGIDYRDGLLVCTTIGIKGPDVVFASMNGGQSWQVLLCDTKIGQLHIDVPYMKPEYNGGGSIIHWMADIKIHPQKPDWAFVTSGTGIFSVRNLQQARCGKQTDWYSDCKGLEETVHLNVYTLPEGPVQVLDIIGDLGGFAFTNLDEPCENTFADEKKDRYITCLNADFPEQRPQRVVATPRGNWTGRTKGGVILSEDYGQSFVHLGYPKGISEKMDELVERIQRPNVDSGWVAITADGETIVWSLAERGRFPADCVVWRELGGDWQRTSFYDKEKNAVSGEVNVHIYADRVNPKLLYGFGNGGRFFVSMDKGKSFWEKSIPEDVPKTLFESWRTHCQIVMDYDIEGVAYLAVEQAGLWRLRYIAEQDCLQSERLTGAGEYARCVGLGVPECTGMPKVIYMVGRRKEGYGFYRSVDNGVSFERINRDTQMFGDIRAICGDRRQFGRFFLATGSRGLLYGQPLQ